MTEVAVEFKNLLEKNIERRIKGRHHVPLNKQLIHNSYYVLGYITLDSQRKYKLIIKPQKIFSFYKANNNDSHLAYYCTYKCY